MDYKKIQDIIRKEWFPEHIAQTQFFATENDELITSIIWSKPGTSIYFVRYLIHKNILYVSGDIGEAIYVWNSPICHEFLANLSIDYFASKCQASESGRGYKSWDAEKAFENVKFWLEDMFDLYWDNYSAENEIETEPTHNDRDAWLIRYLDSRGLSIGDIKEASENHYYWQKLLEQHGYEIFGDDYCELLDRGYAPDWRCHGHLVGLKMSWEQINKDIENATKV